MSPFNQRASHWGCGAFAKIFKFLVKKYFFLDFDYDRGATNMLRFVSANFSPIHNLCFHKKRNSSLLYTVKRHKKWSRNHLELTIVGVAQIKLTMIALAPHHSGTGCSDFRFHPNHFCYVSQCHGGKKKCSARHTA